MGSQTLYILPKRWGLKDLLKDSVDGQFLQHSLKPFHKLGAHTEKAFSSKQFEVQSRVSQIIKVIRP